MALAKSIMKPIPATLGMTDSVSEAAKIMAEHDIGAVMVLENTKLIGIFTERDIVQRVLLPRLDPFSTSLLSVFTRHPVTVPESAHVHDCIRIMQSHHFRHLPVMQSDTIPVGMISAREFLQFIVDELENLVDKSLNLRLPGDHQPNDLRFEMTLKNAIQKIEHKE